jgi:uncharacterized protein YndB with AHSA1/START domain
MPEAATAREISITRVFDAPRELVWKAWTEPDQLACWWGRRGWRTPPSTITMDVRPGGTFRLVSVSDEDGTEMPTEAVYREVVEPERLTFTEVPREGCHEGAVGAVTFTDLGDGRTEMVFHTTVWAIGGAGGAAEAGLASAFDRLAEHLGPRG